MPRNGFYGPGPGGPRRSMGPMGPMGPRRGGGGGLGFLIFFGIIFLFSILDSNVMLAGMSIPLIFVIAVIVCIVLAVKSLNKNSSSSTSSTTSSSSRFSDGSSKGNEVKNIDKKLKTYFEHNKELAIVDNIVLTTINGTYTDLSSLMICANGEKICKLAEFKEEYPDVYNNIYKLIVSFSKLKDDYKEESKQEVKETKKETTNTGISEDDAKSMEFVRKINQLNALIPNEEITNGLYQTTDLLNKIIALDDDKVADKIGKLHEYYLPILISILEKYKNLQDGNPNSEEFKKCQDQLTKTIILINEALKTILNNVADKEYSDLNADMSTLQSLLKKDGYDKDPFKK